MKKSYHILTFLVLLAFGLVSCDGFLDHTPRGAMSEDDMDDPARVDGLIIAAYAGIGNDHWSVPFNSNWFVGGVRADDAYKGGGGTGDQSGYHMMERFEPNIHLVGNVDGMWYHSYQGISRANSALRAILGIDEDDPNRDRWTAEMKFIRGHFHFNLKRHFKHIPFVDESMMREDIENEHNRSMGDQELWDRIADDFRFAVEHLPYVKTDIGRPDNWAAKAYLAKTLLYQAYEQDSRHQVINIQNDLLNEVVDLTTDIINNSPYGLYEDIAMNFLTEYDNGRESIFAVQRSYDDGTDHGRVGMDVGLNYPMNPEFGCCWFNIPSQNLVNAHQTENGLPMFDTYNNYSFRNATDIRAVDVDPRLNHTVSMTGFPFKYDEELVYNENQWARESAVYGPFSSMRELMHPDDPSLQQVGPFYASGKNTDILRFSDVVLWRAEALIELGRHHEALNDINMIRQRAANSDQRLVYEDGQSYANYNVALYQDGVNITWTQDTAREALRWERRLEFAMEGRRLFDLVRWGIAAEVMNDYLETESVRRQFLSGARFVEGRDEYLPIPQDQIEWSGGLYSQNPGYPGARD